MARDHTEEAVKTLMDLAHYATSATAHASFFRLASFVSRSLYRWNSVNI